MQKINEKGITLIALVITIIILLILVGVAIIALTGENGLIKRAQTAKTQTEIADIKEDLQLILLEIKMEILSKEKRNTQTVDCDNLKEKDGITSIEYIEKENKKYALVIYKNYTFKVNEELNIIGDDKNKVEDDIIASGGKYIYNQGEVLKEAKAFIGIKDTNAEYSTEGNDLYMNITSNSSNLGYVGTQEKVNLTNYTKIKCLVSTGEGLAQSGNFFMLVLNDTRTSNVNTIPQTYSSKKIGENQKDYILEYEIPDDLFNKEAYIGAMSCNKDIHIYKIWLEKSETKVVYDYGKILPEIKGFIGIKDTNAEYSTEGNNLYMNITSNSSNLGYVGTQEKVNLTNYTKIRCLVSTGEGLAQSGNFFMLVLNDTRTSNVNTIPQTYSSRKIGENQREYTLKYDIPDDLLNKEAYIGAMNCTGDVYIYKIWLEK